jgi:hypothetical protein
MKSLYYLLPPSSFVDNSHATPSSSPPPSTLASSVFWMCSFSTHIKDAPILSLPSFTTFTCGVMFLLFHSSHPSHLCLACSLYLIVVLICRDGHGGECRGRGLIVLVFCAIPPSSPLQRHPQSQCLPCCHLSCIAIGPSVTVLKSCPNTAASTLPPPLLWLIVVWLSHPPLLHSCRCFFLHLQSSLSPPSLG